MWCSKVLKVALFFFIYGIVLTRNGIGKEKKIKRFSRFTSIFNSNFINLITPIAV